MARKRIAISSAGGIAAGAPFVLGGALFVSQASPAVAFTQRLASLPDANQSIVAPGIAGGLHTFVVGELALDSVNGARSVMVGYNLRANTGTILQQADDQVIIGNTILLPVASNNSQGMVLIGASMVFTVFPSVADSLGNSIVIGNTAGLVCVNAGGGDASNAVCIGQGTRAHGGSVVIGAVASDSGLTAVSIGQQAKAGLQAVAVGYLADATSGYSVCIGQRARGGVDLSGTIAIGWFADCAGSDSGIAIGKSANVNGKTASIALGRDANLGSNNLMVIGSPTFPVNTIRFGVGDGNVNNQIFTLAGSDNFGLNNSQGNSLVLHAGVGTGNWANAEGRGIDLQVGLAVAAGITQQTTTSVLALRHSDLNVSLWGGMGANFDGGVKVLFLANCTTAPAGATVGGAILFAQGGALKAIGSTGVVTVLAA